MGWVVGAGGAGAAGAEIQPYLEGATEEAALSGGRRVAVRGSGTPGRGTWPTGRRLGGARCLPIGFGEDRETRSLPGWALPGWALPGWALAGRGRAIWGRHRGGGFQFTSR